MMAYRNRPGTNLRDIRGANTSNLNYIVDKETSL